MMDGNYDFNDSRWMEIMTSMILDGWKLRLQCFQVTANNASVAAAMAKVKALTGVEVI